MQEIIKLYHTLPTCALLSIKLHILHMIELFFQGDYFLENKLSSKGKDSLNKLLNFPTNIIGENIRFIK